MANERYTRTNQKIFFAGLALDAWRKTELARPANALGMIKAEREAALFHLYGALLGLCHEIAGYYRLPGADVRQAEQLLDPKVLEAAPCPELSELIELAARPDSWLARLLVCYQELYRPPQEPKKVKLDPGLALIEAVSLQDEEPEVSLEQIESWRQSLKNLATRFRETLVEW